MVFFATGDIPWDVVARSQDCRMAPAGAARAPAHQLRIKRPGRRRPPNSSSSQAGRRKTLGGLIQIKSKNPTFLKLLSGKRSNSCGRVRRDFAENGRAARVACNLSHTLASKMTAI